LCASIARQIGASFTNCGRAPTTLYHVRPDPFFPFPLLVIGPRFLGKSRFE
jgi:hypothetical protein